MTTFLEAVRTRRQAVPRPRSIAWRAVGEMVQISVEVINESSERTAPDVLVIEAAAFGAFVPNVPVTRIAVGALDPGEEREVTTTVPRSALDAVTGRRASAALRGYRAVLRAVDGTHWIGNLNVYFDRASAEAVERHCAFGLEVPAGEVVSAMFDVGESGCTCRARCSDPAWSAELCGLPGHVVVRVRTPRDAGRRAHVAVDVTRTLDGKVVTVEFEFETVSGPGQRLGCIAV